MNTEKIVVLTVKLDRFYSIKMDSPGLCVTYYWGNLPAVDLINLPMNEGASYSKPLSLLLCGVGDPRKIQKIPQHILYVHLINHHLVSNYFSFRIASLSPTFRYTFNV